MIKRMIFESIKLKALAALRAQFDVPALPGAFWLESRPFSVLAHLALNLDSYLLNERPALTEFARMHRDTLKSCPDYLANVATGAAERPFSPAKAAEELCLVALKSREEAIALVERWDVRAVASLIKLFPSVFPVALQRASIRCYMEDSEHSPWVVEFDTSAPARRAEACPALG